MSQYIGKTISLISVTDNRYIGLLEDVDSEKGTVTLREVRCFGTEGRRNWGPEEIYPNPTVYNSVKFNGNEVKDLSILDCKLEDVQPMAPPPGAGPQPGGSRVLQQTTQQVQQQQPQLPAASQPQPQPQPQLQRQPVPQAPVQSQPPQPQVPAAVAGYGVYAPNATNADYSSVGNTKQTLKSQNSSKEKTFPKHRNHDQQQKRGGFVEKKVEIPTEDFDFQTSNAKFSKGGDSGEGTVNSPNASSEDHPQRVTDSDDFYDKKSSFFDSISTSTESNTNMRWQEEKEMNLDTFGQASARPRFGGRGGHRGGRGGRGRGRGRGGRGRGGNSSNGRGGYQFNENNQSNNNFGNHQQSQSSSQSHSQNIEF